MFEPFSDDPKSQSLGLGPGLFWCVTIRQHTREFEHFS
jgi:hypothetical protein